LKNVFLALFVALLLSSCAIGENLGNIAGGASAVASAPLVKESVVSWLDGDEKATAELQPVGAFFKIGYDTLTDKPDISVIDLANKSGDYIDEIPAQWDAMKAAFADYEQRSGKPQPAVITQFIANGEQAYAATKKAIATNDRFQSACGIYSSAAPLAALFSPIPLPRSIPGCS